MKNVCLEFLEDIGRKVTTVSGGRPRYDIDGPVEAARIPGQSYQSAGGSTGELGVGRSRVAVQVLHHDHPGEGVTCASPEGSVLGKIVAGVFVSNPTEDEFAARLSHA